MDKTSPEPKKKKKVSTPLILVVVWALIIVLFGFALYQDDSDTDAAYVPVEPQIESPTDEQEEELARVSEMTEEQKEQARGRDLIRLEHMRQLMSALADYNEDNGNYPDDFDNLVPDYISSVPVNPDPGGMVYNYTGIGTKPYSYYEMAYRLEVGTDGIGPGMHIASPDGIAYP